MGGHLCKAHRHPEPLKLTLVGNKVRVIGRSGLKQDVVEANFQVQHTDPLSLPELHTVLPHVVELVLILGHLFVDQDSGFGYPVRLPGLNTQN